MEILQKNTFQNILHVRGVFENYVLLKGYDVVKFDLHRL